MDDDEYLDEYDVTEVVELSALPPLAEGADADEDEDGDGTAKGAGDDSDGELAEETMEERAFEGEGDADDGDAAKVAKGPDNSVQQFRHHTDSVYCIAVSPDGKLAASGDGEDTALMWDVGTGDVRHTLKGHGDTVVAIAFNYNGAFVATGSMDATVRVWDVADGSCVAVCEGMGGEVEWMQWHAKGDVLLAGSTDCTAWMWHVRKGKDPECMAVFAGHVEPVTAGCFTGNGKAVITGSADGSVRIWNPRTSACTHTLSGHGFHEDVINTIVCSEDKPLLLSGSQDGTARLVNYSTGKAVAVFRHGKMATAVKDKTEGGAGVTVDRPGIEEGDEGHPSVESVSICSSHPWVASGATDGSLNVWDTITMIQRHRFVVDDAIVKCAWLPGQPLLAACTADGAVYVFDGRDGKQVAFFTGHAGMILDFAVIPAAEGAPTRIVTAGDDGVCRVYVMP